MRKGLGTRLTITYVFSVNKTHKAQPVLLELKQLHVLIAIVMVIGVSFLIIETLGGSRSSLVSNKERDDGYLVHCMLDLFTHILCEVPGPS